MKSKFFKMSFCFLPLIMSISSCSDFRKAVGKPKNVVGKNLVLHIIKEDVYLSVQFTNWGQSQKGDFSYKRSTKN